MKLSFVKTQPPTVTFAELMKGDLFIFPNFTDLPYMKVTEIRTVQDLKYNCIDMSTGNLSTAQQDSRILRLDSTLSYSIAPAGGS